MHLHNFYYILNILIFAQFVFSLASKSNFKTKNNTTGITNKIEKNFTSNNNISSTLNATATTRHFDISSYFYEFVKSFLFGNMTENYLKINLSLQLNNNTNNSQAAHSFNTTSKSAKNNTDTINEEDEDLKIRLNCTGVNKVVFNSQCETLLTQGPCKEDELLVEDERTEKINCSILECPYPRTLSYNNTCVVHNIFNGCPHGMRLGVTRSGKGICDCRPKFIYSKKHNECYEAYSRGPCKEDEIYILEEEAFAISNTNYTNDYEVMNNTHTHFNLNETEIKENLNQSMSMSSNKSHIEEISLISKCVKNICQKERWVCLNQNDNCTMDSCVEINSQCNNGTGIVLIDDNILEPICYSKKSNTSKLEQVIGMRTLSQHPELSCRPGLKKDITGKCKRTVRFELS